MHPRISSHPAVAAFAGNQGQWPGLRHWSRPPQNDRFGTVLAITLPERRTAPIGGYSRDHC
jgi:hypothetical protein